MARTPGKHAANPAGTRLGAHVVPTVVLAALLLVTAGLTARPERREAIMPTVPVAAGTTIPGRYIVTLRAGQGSTRVAREYKGRGARVRAVYGKALNGFAADLSPALLKRLGKDRRVAAIEPDGRVRGSDTQNAAPWGLDRSDQRALPLSTTYEYSATGLGVRVYVLDTGVRSTHAEFAGRMAPGFDAVGGTSTEDCHGHGTHVAGTAAGKTFGVAKRATVVPVRVLRCDLTGSWSDVIEGVDWVTRNHQPGTPAVANMSLGGGSSAAADTAIRNSIAAGVVYAVAAGNESSDACNYSPPRVTEALTVGATDSYDAKRTTSNSGTCVDLFAPGTGILSATYTSDTATAYKTGTSMAAPHVAGAAALWLETSPSARPADVAQVLRSAATANVVQQAGTGSPNLLLYSKLGGTAPTPSPSPSPTATVSPSPTASPSPTSSATPTPSPSPTATASPSPTATASPSPSPSAPTLVLSATARKVKGLRYVDLSWRGATTTSVDLWRDGSRVSTTANDGAHTDQIAGKGGGTFTYIVCNAGTTVCSTRVTVTF